uniref:Glycosyltransferase family 92 protein n=1 Tax=Parascaris equorum TaxID=6256 RepID=A0A914RU57_PAREQ
MYMIVRDYKLITTSVRGDIQVDFCVYNRWEMCRLKYKFVLVEDVFMVHPGIKLYADRNERLIKIAKPIFDSALVGKFLVKAIAEEIHFRFLFSQPKKSIESERSTEQIVPRELLWVTAFGFIFEPSIKLAHLSSADESLTPAVFVDQTRKKDLGDI